MAAPITRFLLPLLLLAACREAKDPIAPTDGGCTTVPGASPLGAAQGALDAALRPLVVDPTTGRLTAATAAALPAWLHDDATRIVGLGEATHGTKEINDMRAAIVLEMAARAKGTFVFLLEDEYVRSAAIDAYLATGAGSAADGLTALRAGVWKNRELATLLDRLRALRVANPGLRIVFRGVDMQDFNGIFASLGPAAEALGATTTAAADIAAATTESGTYVAAFDAMYDAYSKGRPFDYAPAVAARKRVLAALSRLRTTFEAAPGPGLSATDRALLVRTVRVAEQVTWKVDPLANAVALYGSDAAVRSWLDRVAATVPAADLAPAPDDVRDRAMAENAEALVALEGTGARGVLWAHNGHVARGPVFDAKVAGGHLRDRLGTGYRVLGTEFYRGSFAAVSPDGKPGVFSIAASPATYFANAAARLCRQAGLLDVGAASGDLATALGQSVDLHFIGAAYDPESPPMRGVLGALFDGLVFLRDTSPSAALP